MANRILEVAEFVIFTALLTFPGQVWGRMGQAQAQTWAMTVDSGRDRTTTLHFYFHDTPGGKSPSAIRVAQPAPTSRSRTGFGVLMMADDPLTVGPDPSSKLVGRAQGMYGSACQDEVGLLMAMSYSFIDGPYNGSSISIMGRNSAMQPVREMPVVGGTGLFRMARGYALAHTHYIEYSTGNAVVRYNVTIVH